MKKNLFVKILYILIAFIQVIAIAGVFIVQYLTKKKAGVLHHIYYRKYQFESSIFSPENISMLKVIVMAVIVLFVAICILAIKKSKSDFYKIQTVIGVVLSTLLYFVITSNYFISKVAYYYFIMAFSLVLIIQLIVVVSARILKD